MSRGMLIAGNWKMNTTLDSARELARAISEGAKPSAMVDIAVFPPFPWLVPVREALEGSAVAVGAQNCYIKESGAFTGEVSPAMLAETCKYVLAGHSERRHVFGESNELVGQKVSAILAASLRPVLCVGETLDERNNGDAQRVVQRQLATGVEALDSSQVELLTIAYEPVWAIGTGVAATSADAQQMCAFIRSWMMSRFPGGGGDTRVLYGGSVTPDNAAELLGQVDIDGGLVGGASLKAENFLAIIRAALRHAGM